MSTLDSLLAAIRKIESGGNYSARNKSSGALGAYQVMPSNVKSWTKAALGYSLTTAQFLNSRAAQDAVARYKLGTYLAKYGAEGAASVWFSGQPNPNSKASDGGNTVRQYVDKVMAAMGSGGGGSAVSPSKIAPLDTNALAESYGLSAALINSNAELKKLFKQAVAGGWTADLFTAKLKNTKWWSTQSDTLRQYITLKYTDPATAKQKWDAAIAAMNSLAVQVGAGDLWHSTEANKNLLRAAAYNSLALGWTDARIKDWLGSKAPVTNGMMGGEAGEAYDQLHSTAYLNGMKYSTWYTTTARKIAGGQMTLEQAEAAIRAQAAAKYSAFADQIKAGQNVMDLAAPYIQSVAKILEVPDTDVDLFNSHINKAMTSNTKGQAESIWQFENELRQDPLWRKTQNAQDGVMQVAHQVLTQFGMVF